MKPEIVGCAWGGVELTWAYAVWFMDLPPGRSNYMMVLMKDKDGKLTAISRIRIDIHNSGPFDFKDRKSWYQHSPRPGASDEEFEKKIDEMVRAFAASVPGATKVEKIRIDGGPAHFLEVMQRQPWMNMLESVPE